MPSLYLYLRRNLKKVVGLALVTALGVAGVLTVSSVFASFGDTRWQMLSGQGQWAEVISRDRLTDETRILFLGSSARTNGTLAKATQVDW